MSSDMSVTLPPSEDLRARPVSEWPALFQEHDVPPPLPRAFADLVREHQPGSTREVDRSSSSWRTYLSWVNDVASKKRCVDEYFTTMHDTLLAVHAATWDGARFSCYHTLVHNAMAYHWLVNKVKELYPDSTYRRQRVWWKFIDQEEDFRSAQQHHYNTARDSLRCPIVWRKCECDLVQGPYISTVERHLLCTQLCRRFYANTLHCFRVSMPDDDPRWSIFTTFMKWIETHLHITCDRWKIKQPYQEWHNAWHGLTWHKDKPTSDEGEELPKRLVHQVELEFVEHMWCLILKVWCGVEPLRTANDIQCDPEHDAWVETGHLPVFLPKDVARDDFLDKINDVVLQWTSSMMAMEEELRKVTRQHFVAMHFTNTTYHSQLRPPYSDLPQDKMCDTRQFEYKQFCEYERGERDLPKEGWRTYWSILVDKLKNEVPPLTPLMDIPDRPYRDNVKKGGCNTLLAYQDHWENWHYNRAVVQWQIKDDPDPAARYRLEHIESNAKIVVSRVDDTDHHEDHRAVPFACLINEEAITLPPLAPEPVQESDNAHQQLAKDDDDDAEDDDEQGGGQEEEVVHTSGNKRARQSDQRPTDPPERRAKKLHKKSDAKATTSGDANLFGDDATAKWILNNFCEVLFAQLVKDVKGIPNDNKKDVKQDQQRRTYSTFAQFQQRVETLLQDHASTDAWTNKETLYQRFDQFYHVLVPLRMDIWDACKEQGITMKPGATTELDVGKCHKTFKEVHIDNKTDKGAPFVSWKAFKEAVLSQVKHRKRHKKSVKVILDKLSVKYMDKLPSFFE